MPMSVRIALFADKNSAQLAEIATAVAAAGGTPIALDMRLGGSLTESTQPEFSLEGDGARWGGVDFTDIRAMHIRCTAPRTLPTLPPVLNALSHAEYRTSFLREQLFNAATIAFFEHQAARGKLVVNRLTTAYVDHNSKSQFYEKLRDAGFSVPRSLTTDDPESARRFLDEVDDAVIKPMIGIGSTRAVGPGDRARLEELRTCPALFQERIKGPTLRIHVVGDRMVLALRIIGEGIDSRTDAKDFIETDLAPDEAAAIVRANRFLGLHYAAWDAIEGPDGRLCYLDCNPGPFVMWLPEAARRTVFGALARYLVEFARK
ncbi:MAG: ATP-grasp domain-containing protein [Rhodospirillaceae bacterium]